MRDSHVTLYIEVDPEMPSGIVAVRILNTGDIVHHDDIFVGTVREVRYEVDASGSLTPGPEYFWHVYRQASLALGDRVP
jgi:hypothetical protein